MEQDGSTEAPVCDACRSFPNRRRVDGRPASCSMRSSTSTTQPVRRRDGLVGLAANEMVGRRVRRGLCHAVSSNPVLVPGSAVPRRTTGDAAP
jgi:hypothetical protein